MKASGSREIQLDNPSVSSSFIQDYDTKVLLTIGLRACLELAKNSVARGYGSQDGGSTELRQFHGDNGVDLVLRNITRTSDRRRNYIPSPRSLST